MRDALPVLPADFRSCRRHLAARTLAPRLALALAFTLASAAGPGEELRHVDAPTRSALALNARPARGAALFTRHCSGCHGATAHGDPERDIPSLAGQRVAYLVHQLANFAAGERDSDAMHRVTTEPALREPQAWADLAAYLNRLPPPAVVQTGDGRDVALGRGIFHEQCASCHPREVRRGDRGFVPRLSHQHYGYLVVQLHGLATGRRHDADPDLVRFLQSFDDRDVAAVADYLSRLPPPAREGAQSRAAGTLID